ncbi:MAG: hypothetical protein Q7S87_03215 [Agitococcus sp.]|nr:hypothetical protein [Agitococcus sp.]
MSKTPTQQAFEQSAKKLFGWSNFDVRDNISFNMMPVYVVEKVEQAWLLFQSALAIANAASANAEPVAWHDRGGVRFSGKFVPPGAAFFLAPPPMDDSVALAQLNAETARLKQVLVELNQRAVVTARTEKELTEKVVLLQTELTRIASLSTCSTIKLFLALPNKDKASWFVLGLDESDRRHKAENERDILAKAQNELQNDLTALKRSCRLKDKTLKYQAESLATATFALETLQHQAKLVVSPTSQLTAPWTKTVIQENLLKSIAENCCVNDPSDFLRNNWLCAGPTDVKTALNELLSIAANNAESDIAELHAIADARLARVFALEKEALSCVSVFYDPHLSLVAQCRAMDQLETAVTGNVPEIGRLPPIGQ